MVAGRTGEEQGMEGREPVMGCVTGALSCRGHAEEPVECSSECSHQEMGELEMFTHSRLLFFG